MRLKLILAAFIVAFSLSGFFAAPHAAAMDVPTWLGGSWNVLHEVPNLGAFPGRVDLAVDESKSARASAITGVMTLRHPETQEWIRLNLTSYGPISGKPGWVTLHFARVAESHPGSTIPQRQSRPMDATIGARIIRLPDGLKLRATIDKRSANVTAVRLPLDDVAIELPAAKAAESLLGNWRSPGARKFTGAVFWFRPSPQILSTGAVDLRAPEDLKRFHRVKRARIYKRFVDRFGDDAYEVVWLRIEGVDLPVEPMRKIALVFTDPLIEWTGEKRPGPSDGATGPTLEFRVKLKKGVRPGRKKFSLNGTVGEWDYRIEPLNASFVRQISGGTSPKLEDFETIHQAYQKEFVRVLVRYENIPLVDGLKVIVKAGQRREYRIPLRRIESATSRSIAFITDAVLLRKSDFARSAGRGKEAGSVEQFIIPANNREVLRAIPVGVQPSAQGSPVARAIVVDAPGDLWRAALARAQRCRESDSSPKEFSSVIFSEFKRRSLTISLQDHAAALLLRDELAHILDEWARSELIAISAVSVSGKFADPRILAAESVYNQELIQKARNVQFSEGGLLSQNVNVPLSKEGSLPLATALSRRAEERFFKGNHQNFLLHARKVIREARSNLAKQAQRSRQTALMLGDCKIIEIFKVIHSGIGPTTSRVLRKMLRRRRPSDPQLPLWVPDRPARSHVRSVAILANAVLDQEAYSAIDTNVALVVATIALTGGSGLAALSAEGLTGLESGALAARTATGAARVAAGLAKGAKIVDGINTALFVHSLISLGKFSEEETFSQGLVGIGGTERYREARRAAHDAAFGAWTGAGLLLGGAAFGKVVQRIQRWRGGADVSPIPSESADAGARGRSARLPPPSEPEPTVGGGAAKIPAERRLGPVDRARQDLREFADYVWQNRENLWRKLKEGGLKKLQSEIYGSGYAEAKVPQKIKGSLKKFRQNLAKKLEDINKDRPDGATLWMQSRRIDHTPGRIDELMPDDWYHYRSARFGEVKSGDSPVQLRVPIRASVDHGAELMDLIVHEMVDDTKDFAGVMSAKIAGVRPAAIRADNILIYIAERENVAAELTQARVLRRLSEIRRQHPTWFVEGTPPMTYQEFPGVSTATNPPRGMGSFGSVRSNALAEALVSTDKEIQLRGPDFNAKAFFYREVTRSLKKVGIDPATPHLQSWPASTDGRTR